MIFTGVTPASPAKLVLQGLNAILTKLNRNKMFDFQSYVERREANPGRKSIRLQNYAYIDDIENLREIADNEIICQAISLGLQAWQFAEGKKLRKSAKDVDKKLERVSLAWREVCFVARRQRMPVYFLHG